MDNDSIDFNSDDLSSNIRNGHTFTLIFDGGYNRTGGYGSYVIFKGNKLIVINLRMQFSDKLVKTGNQAEYYTLVRALDNLQNYAPRGSRLRIIGDSKLVLSQVAGEWKTNNPKLKTFRDMCRDKLEGYKWSTQWWEREQSLQFFEH